MGKYVCSAFGTLCILYLLLLPPTVSAQPAASSVNVTVIGKHLPLSAILKSISKQTGYFFVFDNAILDESEKVTVHFRKVPWEHVLTVILKDRNIAWTVQQKRIFLQKTLPASGTTIPGNDSITYTVKGTIRTAGDQPVPGATIMLKGTRRGITTSNDGTFTLSELPLNAELHISSLGFTPIDTLLQQGHSHIIHLREAINSLDAAVVIGYGASSRRLLTGNVNRISAAQIGNQPAANPLATLQGQIPGVLVTNTNGLPGAEIKVYIRGRNSIAAGNDPLFIIDGVPFDIAPLNNDDDLMGAAWATSPFNSINPAEIESIEILKDADATAIYGSRGANGVVLISSKKGKKGKPLLDLNIYQGAGRTDGTLKMLNTQQYVAMRKEAFQNDGVIPDAENAPDLVLWDTTRYTNWQRYLTSGTVPVTNVQLSYAGGNEQTTFRLAGNYYREGTISPAPLHYYRGGGHLSIQHHNRSNRLEINSTTLYSADLNKSVVYDIFSLFYLPPNFALYNDDGSLHIPASVVNPLAAMQQSAISKTTNLLSNAVIRYHLLPGLFLKTSAGYSSLNMPQVFVFPFSSQLPNFNPISKTRVSDNRRSGFIIEPQADYTMRIAKGSLHALIGGTFQRMRQDAYYSEGQGYADESDLGSLAGADTIIRRPDTRIEYRYISFFTRWNYNWLDKYLLNLSYRRDGSSRFGPGRQFGDFGAIGAAWIFSAEPWMHQLEWLSFGKLRFSGGLTGNDQVPDYQFVSNYGTSGNYQNATTLKPLRISNDKYSWEENRKLEVALEMGFNKDRFFLSIAHYDNHSSNQLMGYQLPGISGFYSYLANLPAIVRNTGWELEFTSVNARQQDFRWTSTLNATIFKNKLEALPQQASSVYTSTYVVGQSLNTERGYHYQGVDPATGLVSYQDINKDGRISSYSDYVNIANKDPHFYAGLTNDLTYKQFSLSCFIQYVNQEGRKYVNTPGVMRNEMAVVANRWQHPGDKATVQKASALPDNPGYDLNALLPLSDAAFTGASYLRLRNVMIAYQLPAHRFTSAHVKEAKVYVQAQNLLTFTSYIGANPETQLSVPPLKILAGGIQLTL
jgi:TonB-linked SusC/RagA family outer membrane protein